MSFLDRFKGKKKDNSQNNENMSSKQTLEEESLSGAPLQEQGIENKNEEKVGFFEKFKKGLSKTRKNLGGKIDELIKSNKKLDENFYEELEEILIQADIGVNTSLELVENIRKNAKKRKLSDSSQVYELIKEEITNILNNNNEGIDHITETKPEIILVVGVNGAGKTTSIAKLAYMLKNENNKVLLAAGDTFRAAAIDQLQTWADRIGVELIKHQEGSDPGAVVYDAINAAKSRKADYLIVDTAGRLQNKTNLMKELSKIRKVIERETPEGVQDVLLVLDATTGQNAISQAKIFEEATGVSGIILTKLDGTAKGGIVIAIAKELNIPVKLVGIGEGLEDLKEFSASIFAEALFENKEE
ncbi:Signal recognition particle receptor FtsY [Candidatus Syntrophocurvum alkaliphilum]|uniref:Signal recognition particle receptor FtsY n=1 Tax=Candidatus Syntrophocurvum alkaliphilum TaxID=2293317 RepID=A0A6I6DED9_9FIRM|nr:signal recognition particle-docking protein FtsY [Candidatus Syntrophocurvum alkaliphilum]QGT99092.1 Signal recognition particle receptor FtsY [Candidatus Syntrophocurvum alkaliphilum]